MSKRSDKDSKNTGIEIIGDQEIEEDDSGGSQVEESYGVILEKLGVSTKDMSVEEIRNLIHEYEQEGLVKGAKIIDFTTGKSKKTYRKPTQSQGRAISVKEDATRPVTEAELAAIKKEEKYKQRSDKTETPAPKNPFNPKPSGPK